MAAYTSKAKKNLLPMAPLEAALTHHSVSQRLLYFLPGTYQNLQSCYLWLYFLVTLPTCCTRLWVSCGKEPRPSWSSLTAQILALCLSHKRVLTSKCWVKKAMSPGKQRHSLITIYHFRNISLNLGILLRKMLKEILFPERTEKLGECNYHLLSNHHVPGMLILTVTQ